MLSDPQIALVCSGRHGDPFSVLGIQRWQGRDWLRAMLPGAGQVVALEARSGELLTVLAPRHPDGLFEAMMPAGATTDYRLQVRWADGSSTITDDPYRFGPVLDEIELARHAKGVHLRPSELLGAVPRVLDRITGTSFAVWAPNASRVSLVGDFNHWDGRQHGMRLRHGFGVWEIFLPGVGVGVHYKYEIRSHAGRVLPAKSDPYALQCEAPPGTNSVTAELRPVTPAAASGPRPMDPAPMSIYEVHLGSWRRPAAPGRGRSPTWDELADTLAPYASELGFTHLELLPIGEHPFDGSWGYQQTGPYAPTARFGNTTGFARFVDRCHAEGLKVIVAWVPHHFPSDPHGLARFDGSRLYEGAENDRDNAADWNTLAFDAARPQVRNYLVANALFWLERYAVDGLRVADAPDGNADTAARALIEEVQRQMARLRPEALMVGSASAPATTGFDLRWDGDWTDGVLRYMACDPAQRAARFADMSSHAPRAIPVVLALAHDRVLPEQGSLLGRLPGSRSERFAQLRAFYGFMYAHPGRKLLFMGNEFAHAREWQHEQGLDWSLLDEPAHRGVQRLVGALNRLLRATPALYERDADPAAFEWIAPGDGESALLCFLRRGHDAESQVIAVCNFGAAAQSRLSIGVPQPGRYVECLNTDAIDFGGASVTTGAAYDAEATGAHGRAHSFVLDVTAFTTVLLEWQP
ncbi:MAG: 1,4-alpha-glucan-branching protein [Burkholderiaceae bacterium]